MTTLYIVRHAEAEGNIKEFFQGRIDTEISENGRKQLELLAERFKDVKIDAIYSSTLKRARETAEKINIYHNLTINTDSGLVEIDGGKFEGKSWAELPELYPEQYRKWKTQMQDFQAPDGESMTDVYNRMVSTVNKIVEENQGKTILIVSHGCAVRNYLCYACGKPLSEILELGWSDNTAVSKIVYDDEMKPKVIFKNNSDHLTPETSTIRKSHWCKGDKIN